MRFLVTSMCLYACESWTLTVELQGRIQAMEMRSCRKILHISYKDHVTNKEVHAKIQQALGPHKDLTIVKICKLQWYGHVSLSSGLAKTILQSTVKRGRRQGRQRKRWEDNIREWTGLEFAKSQRAVENREKWRKLVAKSSVVPQWPLHLRDRWEMRDTLEQGQLKMNHKNNEAVDGICCWLCLLQVEHTMTWTSTMCFPGCWSTMTVRSWTYPLQQHTVTCQR